MTSKVTTSATSPIPLLEALPLYTIRTGIGWVSIKIPHDLHCPFKKMELARGSGFLEDTTKRNEPAHELAG